MRTNGALNVYAFCLGLQPLRKTTKVGLSLQRVQLFVRKC